MAKLLKVTTYIVDCNDEYPTADSLEDHLRYLTQHDLNLDHIQIEAADIGEWYDEHPLNYVHCPKAEYEKYFKENHPC